MLSKRRRLYLDSDTGKVGYFLIDASEAIEQQAFTRIRFAYDEDTGHCAAL